MTGAPAGRPRDPRVDTALRDHLVQLLAERGPDGFSVDELAARSQVSRAAIYRRYSGREELVEAGFAAVNEDMPDVSALPVREALIALLTWIAGAHASGMTPTWMIGMQRLPQVGELYAQKVVAPRRAALREVVERGVAQGLLDADVDLEVLVTCLSAPAILIGMHKARKQPAGDVPVAAVVDLVLAGALSPAARASGS
jgi:AcrR family transcriptional regulator